MKILYVTHSFPPHHWRGTEIYTFELAREMQKTHEVSVAYLLDEDAGEKPGLRRAEYHGIPVFQVVKRLRHWEPEDYFFNPDMEKLFQQLLAEYRPEVVHFTYFLGGFSANCLLLAESAARVVVTITDFAAFCPRGQLLDQGFDPCPGPRGALRCVRCLFDQPILFQNRSLDSMVRNIVPATFARFINHPKLLLLRRKLKAVSTGLRGADHVIFSNADTRRVFVDQGFRFNLTHVLDFGIDTTPYRHHIKTPTDRMRLGYIGQILPHKGLQTLIQAVKGLPEDMYRLVIYGSLDDPGSREFFESLNIDSRKGIQHQGIFDFSNMNEVLKDIDVLVVPSIWHENCPLIVKYGLATRTRLILSDVPGIMPEDVRCEGIYRFPANDAEVLRELIMGLVETGDWKRPVESERPLVTDIREHAELVERIYRI